MFIFRYISFESSRPQHDNNLPVAFSLMHPLDEIYPLLIKHGKKFCGIKYGN